MGNHAVYCCHIIQITGLSFMWAAEKYPDGGSSRRLDRGEKNPKKTPAKWLKIVWTACWLFLVTFQHRKGWVHQSNNDKFNKMSKILLWWQYLCLSSKLFYNGKNIGLSSHSHYYTVSHCAVYISISLLPLSGDCRYPIHPVCQNGLQRL